MEHLRTMQILTLLKTDQAAMVSNNTNGLSSTEITSLVVLPTIGVLSIFGNSVLIYLVMTTPNKRDFINYFVFSLALVDMITAIGIIPLQCLQIAGVFSAEDYACPLVVFFILTVALASVYSLLAVTFERHLIIAKPLRRMSMDSIRRFVVGTLIFLWGYSIGVGSLVLYVPKIKAPKDEREGKSCGMNHLVDSKGYSLFILSNFVLPIPIMVILYSHIFVIARRQLRSVADQVDPQAAGSNTSVRMQLIRREFRTALVLFFITAYYILSWLVVFVLVASFYGILKEANHIITTMDIIIYLNAALNPWIYAWANKPLRKHFIRLITGRRDDPRRYSSAVPPGSTLSSSMSLSRRRDTDILNPPSLNSGYLY